MSRAPITVLAFALTFGSAGLADGARAAPRPCDDGRAVAATGAVASPRIAVALPPRRAAVADPDIDGVVSHAEAARYYEARFALVDRDRDGRLSGREFLRSPGIPSLPALGGTWAAPLGFDAVDGDGNGAITPEEFLMANRWRSTWSTGAAAARQRQAIFDRLDADRDAALSKQEFTNAGAEDFAASDADGDGQVTVREFYAGQRL